MSVRLNVSVRDIGAVELKDVAGATTLHAAHRPGWVKVCRPRPRLYPSGPGYYEE